MNGESPQRLDGFPRGALIEAHHFRQLSHNDTDCRLKMYFYPEMDTDPPTPTLKGRKHKLDIDSKKVKREIDDAYTCMLNYLLDGHKEWEEKIRARQGIVPADLNKYLVGEARMVFQGLDGCIGRFNTETQCPNKTAVQDYFKFDQKIFRKIARHNRYALKCITIAIDEEFEGKAEIIQILEDTLGHDGEGHPETDPGQDPVEQASRPAPTYADADLEAAMLVAFSKRHPTVWNLSAEDKVMAIHRELNDRMQRDGPPYERDPSKTADFIQSVIMYGVRHKDDRPSTGKGIPYETMARTIELPSSHKKHLDERGWMKAYGNEPKLENYFEVLDKQFNYGRGDLSQGFIRDTIGPIIKKYEDHKKRMEAWEQGAAAVRVKEETPRLPDPPAPAVDQRGSDDQGTGSVCDDPSTRRPSRMPSPRRSVSRPNYDRRSVPRSEAGAETSEDIAIILAERIIGSLDLDATVLDFYIPRFCGFDIANEINDNESGSLVLRETEMSGQHLSNLCDDALEACYKVKDIPNMNQHQQRDMVREVKSMKTSLTNLMEARKKFVLLARKNYLNRPTATGTCTKRAEEEMEGLMQESDYVTRALREAIRGGDSYLTSLKATDSRVSAGESNSLKESVFTGTPGLGNKTIFEYLEEFEERMVTKQISYDGKGKILKSKLKGPAQNVVPQDINDYKQVVTHLARKFGGAEYVLSQIINLHRGEKRIPSAVGVASRTNGWNVIGERADNHLTIIRKVQHMEKLQIAAKKSKTATNTARYAKVLCEIVPEEIAAKYIGRVENEAELVCEMCIKEVQNSFNTAVAMGATWSTKTKETKETVKETASDASRRDSRWESRKEKYDYSYSRRNEFKPKDKPVRTVNTTTKVDKVVKNQGGRGGFTGQMDNDKCDLCPLLQEHQIGSKYFKKHLMSSGSFIRGQCPVYMALKAPARVDFIKKAGLCPKCLKKKDKNHDCRPNPKAMCEHCKDVRIENCEKHKKENEKRIEKKNHFYTQHNVKLTMHMVAQEDKKFEDEPVIRKSVNFLDTINCSQARDIKAKGRSSKRANAKSIERPLQMTKREIMEDPSVMHSTLGAEAMMMYGRVKGRDRPLNFLYDTGANVTIIRDSVLGNQIPGHKTNESIHISNYSGGEVMKKWLVHLPLMDGTCVLSEAFSAGKEITPHRVIKNCSAVFNEAKPEVKEKTGIDLAKADITDTVGGVIDGLIGINLLDFFPEIVCSLSNGYTIFRTKFMPHSERSEYLIGGIGKRLSNGAKIESVAIEMLTMLEKNGLDGLEELNIHLIDAGFPSSNIREVMNITTRSGLKTVERHIKAVAPNPSAGKQVDKKNENIVEDPVEKPAKKNAEKQGTKKKAAAKGTKAESTEIKVDTKLAGKDMDVAEHLESVTAEIIAEKQAGNKEKAVRRKERHAALDASNEDKKKAQEVMKNKTQEEKEALKKERRLMKALEDDINALPLLLEDSDEDDVTPQEKIAKDLLNIKSRANRETLQDARYLCETVNLNPTCPPCTEFHHQCVNCGKLDPFEKSNVENHQDMYKINQSLWVNGDNVFECKLPFKVKDEDVSAYLTTNMEEARLAAIRTLKKIRAKNDPDITEMLRYSFEKLVNAGYVCKYKDLTEEQRSIVDQGKVQLFIIWNTRFKLLSQSTPARIIYNGSAISGKTSLNELLIKGDLKGRLRFEKVAVYFGSDKIGVNADISKFFNNVRLRNEDWCMHQIWWTDSMDPDAELERYVFKTCLYGIASSSILTETAMERIAEEHKHNKKLYECLTTGRFVDDLFAACSSYQEADQLVLDIQKSLGKYGMKIKGAAVTGRPPPPEMVDENGYQSACGYLFHCESDTLRLNVPPLNFTSKHDRGREVGGEEFKGTTLEELSDFVPKKLTPRICLSKPAKVFDPRRFLGPYDINIKCLMRVTRQRTQQTEEAQEKGLWDAEIPEELRPHWVKVFHDLIKGGEYKFPRFKNKNANTEKCTLFCFSDAANFGSTEAVYGGWRNEESGLMETQLLICMNQINPIKIKKEEETARLELKALGISGALAKRCEQQLGGKERVDEVYFFCDSKVATFWTQKSQGQLAKDTRRRVAHFLGTVRERFPTAKEVNLYWLPSQFNVCDLGTRPTVRMEDLSPDSVWFNGPFFLKDIKKAEEDGIIVHHTKLVLNAEEKEVLLDDMPGKAGMPEEYLMINNMMRDDVWDDIDYRMAGEFEVMDEEDRAIMMDYEETWAYDENKYLCDDCDTRQD